MTNPHLERDDTIFRCAACHDRIEDEADAVETRNGRRIHAACAESNDDPLARPIFRVNFPDSLTRRIKEAV